VSCQSLKARDLRKVFRTVKRTPGALGAFASLFSPEYEERVAVGDVTFALEPGELVGYIGPNGAASPRRSNAHRDSRSYVGSGPRRRIGSVEKPQGERSHIGVVFGQRSQLYWICR